MGSKVVGIYQIRNLVSGKVYVGQSQDVYRRFHDHRGALRSCKHFNSHLQRSWDKWGENCFIFEVVEPCDVGDLDETENRHLEKNRGISYNFALKASGPGTFSKDTREKLSKSKMGRRNPAYDHTIYSFKHVDGRTLVGTKGQVRRQARNSRGIYRLISGKTSSVFGWYLDKPHVIPGVCSGKRHYAFDTRVYVFEHETGARVSCTIQELCDQFDLPRKPLVYVCRGRYLSYRGWRLENCRPLKQNQRVSYKFENSDGTIRNCTQDELVKEFDLNCGHVSSLCAGRRKSHKGWRVVSRLSPGTDSVSALAGTRS